MSSLRRTPWLTVLTVGAACLAVAVPLLRPDGPLGVAAASYRHDRAFTSEQLATMQRAVALWTTEALTADLLPRVVQFAREQEVRARMSEAIEANAGHAVTTHILADAAMEGMGADRCSIWVFRIPPSCSRRTAATRGRTPARPRRF